MHKIKDLFYLSLPYKWNVFFNVIFNLLGVLFNLFSLLLFIPFLSLLFNKVPPIAEKPAFEWSKTALENRLNYEMGQYITQSGPEAALIFICLLVLIMFFLKNLFIYLGVFTISTMRSGILRDLRSKIYHKILYLPLGYYSEERKGDIISRVSNDVIEVEFSILNSIEMFFREPVAIVINIVVLVAISPQMTLFTLLLLPISGLVIGKIGKSLKKSSHLAQAKMGDIITVIEETLGGLRIVKAFNSELNMINRFKNFNESHYKTMLQVVRKRDLASPLNEFLGAVVLVSLVWFGGKLVLNGESTLSGETFLGYIIVFSQLMRPVTNLTKAFSYIQKGFASLERINHILKAENPIRNAENALEITVLNDKIEYKNVYFAYNEGENVLQNISLTIEKGKSIALVGSSGSGKSTMVDLLPRFYDIQTGEISIDNLNIKQIKISSLRHLFGIVSQESILFNDTIKENILFGKPGASDVEIIEAAKIANAHDFIMQLENGYETNIGDRGSKLSGGQRQRIAIARAVLKNPPVLILDEATSALDTESERLVQDALEKLMKNRTSIIIAHRLSTVKNANEIIVMQKGKIAERGTHESLIIQNGIYKSLVELNEL